MAFLLWVIAVATYDLVGPTFQPEKTKIDDFEGYMWVFAALGAIAHDVKYLLS